MTEDLTILTDIGVKGAGYGINYISTNETVVNVIKNILKERRVNFGRYTPETPSNAYVCINGEGVKLHGVGSSYQDEYDPTQYEDFKMTVNI